MTEHVSDFRTVSHSKRHLLFTLLCHLLSYMQGMLGTENTEKRQSADLPRQQTSKSNINLY